MELNNIVQAIVNKAVEYNIGADFCKIEDQLKKQRNENKSDVHKRTRVVEAFFLGPRGENSQFFKKIIEDSVFSHILARKSYQMDDKLHITREMQKDPSFLEAQDSLERGLSYLNTKLRDLSPPYYSPRYFGHMCWETSIPAMIGYFSTMLYNPNNTAFEASPFTTQLQIDCMVEFAQMFKYPAMLRQLSAGSGTTHSWGHLTCGGTVANSEAFWAARSVKYLAFGLKKYIQSLQPCQYAKVENVQVRLATGEMKRLIDTCVWELLNVPNDETMILNEEIFNLVYDKDSSKYGQFQDATSNFTLGKLGFINVSNALQKDNKENPDALWPDNKVPEPLSYYAATGHYSMPKAVSLLGMGEGSLHKIEVDLDTRMDTVKLENQLIKCSEAHIPVLVVVGIVGSTEESTVDNLVEILNIKQRMMKRGLFFHFHIDGAYGSYFVSMIREIQPGQTTSFSQYVKNQLAVFNRSDSITFDPHKTGYVPYSCGGIIYRNYRLRNNLSFSAPYIFSGFQPNNAIYGIEGSKPGAAVSAVYLSLQVMPLQRSGHGQLLERTMMNTKIFTASLYGMKDTEFVFDIQGTTYREHFTCCVLPRTYVEKYTGNQQEQDAAYRKIASTPISGQNALLNDPAVSKYYYEVGPDLNIVCYCVNFFDKVNNCWNTSLQKLNKFNETLVRISKPVGDDLSIRCKDLYVSETKIEKKYGDALINDFLGRWNITNDLEKTEIEFIRSTIMNPFFTEQSTVTPNSTFINQLAENSCEALHFLNNNGWK